MTPRRILGAGWLAFLLYAYPGYMKGDAIDQLADSRTGAFTDWHSPVMTEVWRIVECVIAGPPGMLFLQSLLVLAGSYHLLRRVLADRAAALAAVGVLLFPPLLATTALISAEAQLAGFLVAGAAALASPRRAIRMVGLGLMFVACGMRDGGAAAALPIVVATFRWDDEVRWRRVAFAATAWGTIAVAAAGTTRLLVDLKTERNEVALATSDILGTLRYADELDDARLRTLLDGTPLATTTDIQAHARRVYADPATAPRVFDEPRTDGQRAALLAARRGLAREAPRAYLTHRWHQLRAALGLAARARWPVYTDFVTTPETRAVIRHAAWHSLVQTKLIGAVTWLSKVFKLLFRPYVYGVLALVLLPVAAIRRQRDTAALLASAVLYELALMFDVARAELRDSHWMLVATVLAVILLVARRWGSEVGHERIHEQAALGVSHDGGA